MDESPSKLKAKESSPSRMRSPMSVRSFGKKRVQEEEPSSQVLRREGVAVVEPKVFESFEPIPGKVPRKVVLDRKRKLFASQNIEELLKKDGLDLSKPQNAWLPLEPFDNYDAETRTPEEWLSFAGESNDAILALALYRDPSNPETARWRSALVTSWEKSRNKFTGTWDDSLKGNFQLPKIAVLFSSEDPSRFADRMVAAYQRRKFAENLIRYNFYIDNMPMEEVPTLTSVQKQGLLRKATASLGLRHSYAQENSAIMVEVANGYSRVMNKIIFDKHFQESPKELLATNLELPPAPGKQPAPQFALVQIPQHDFKLLFSDFCVSSLNVRGEVINTTVRTKELCRTAESQHIFHLTFERTMKLEDFRLFQSGALSQISSYLKSWKDSVHVDIKSGLMECTALNLQEPSKDAYEQGKLKKFLTMVKLMMQDSLLQMVMTSANQFVEAMEKIVPLEVAIQSANLVENKYPIDPQLSAIDPEHAKVVKPVPLFSVDIMRTSDGLAYSTELKKFVERVVGIFEEGLMRMKDQPVIEEVVMEHLFRRQGTRNMLKAPTIPQEEPQIPTQAEKNQGRLLDENAWLWHLRTRLLSLMEKAVEPLEKYLTTFSKFDTLMQLNVEVYIKTIQDLDPPKTIDELRDEIRDRRTMQQNVLKDIPDSIEVSCFLVGCKELRAHLAGKHSTIADAMLELIAQRTRDSNNALQEYFKDLFRQIGKPPKDIEELTAIKELMARVPQELEKKKLEIEEAAGMFIVLEKFGYRLAAEDLNRRWEVFGYPQKTLELIDTKLEELEKEKATFRNQTVTEQAEFKENIEDLENIVKSFQQYTDIAQYEENAAMVENINKRIEDGLARAKMYNHREYLFGMETTDYSQVSQCAKDFKPYSDLWLTVRKWYTSHQHWMHDPWETLQGNEIEEVVDTSNKTITTVHRYFKNRDMQTMLAIAETVKNQVTHFSQYVKMAVALRKPGMTDRHWDQISQKMGSDVRPREGFTLTTVIDMGLKQHEDFCEEVGERAYKEHQIEVNLKKMLAAWEGVDFDVLPAKGTDSYLLGGFDKVQTILDEHILQAQAMQLSPFKKPFEEEIEDWVKTLMLVQDIIEEWAKCQVSWMYLSPIFDSKDIARQLPTEHKKFKTVDTMWKTNMTQVKAQPGVLLVSKKEGRLDAIRDSNKLLEMVQKGLNQYLETKRTGFARFYFLSDDELLSILSETKDPTRVQPHLRKVFENMSKLDYSPEGTFTAMYSSEGEVVQYVKPVNPKDKDVTFWMGEVEEMMRVSVRHVLKTSIDDYVNGQRNNWVLRHIGQCVLNGSQVHWTTEVENAIKANSVSDYFKFLEKQLLETVALVRGQLNKLQNITVGALIVIDVHAKDVVEKLVENNITSVEDFEWISQLRYYWEQNDTYVKCIQTRFPYGYEYLGNTPRLVITPLTDKCYMTLMGALNLNLGGAPAGPAGTGKTESVKDLSKALAKQVVVFNCSEGMDFIMVGKFFKGLASSGAWACFDEFNRIYIEVLSVIAQQLQQLLDAKRQGMAELEFEGSLIRMQPTFSVFITMNPGYAGRTELPDNLKALFRAVAMMVPDYALIGEIMLYSFGFSKARDLAKKMVATFKLSSEQLSSQDHYDYGMRAVRSVINSAGLIKRAEPDMNEDQLLLRALRDVNVPKFLKDDLPLFENIILDLFPGVERPKIERGQLLVAIKEICNRRNLQPEDIFIEKVFQLYDTIQVRHGLMIVGPTGGAKTCNYKVLGTAMSSIKHMPGFDEVFFHILNPKAIKMGQLYGQFDELTHEWTDGILANIIRNCVKDQHNPPYTNKHWVMFDGPVDALWIENMNTVLDDNKKLCLNSGEIIPLSPHMTMMFEVEDLEVASPATVSRCGMVYMEPSALGLKPLVKSWVRSIPPKLRDRESIQNALIALHSLYTYPLIHFLRRNITEPVSTVDNNLCQSICRIMNCYFATYVDSELKIISADEISDLETFLENLFIYAVTWSLGCTGTVEGRRKFDTALREILNGRTLTPAFPADRSVFDWCFDSKERKYRIWLDIAPRFEVDARLNFSEIIMPTQDSIRSKYLCKLLLTNKYNVLVPGPTGTGKSVNTETLLAREMPENFQSITLTFSAQTSANQTQDMIDPPTTQRRRKGVFGPPPGKIYVIFVDDLNMPKKEKYGAQPPIELIRQWMDHKGWYNRKELVKVEIEDIVFISAMGPPGGGRTFITNRLMRHFNILTYTYLSENDIANIFTRILESFLQPYTDQIRLSVSKIVQGTIEVYNAVEKTLLPTPSKSHYTFNLRDMSHVFQGMVSSHHKTVTEYVSFMRLWVHENMRVFGDRLVNYEDQQWLVQQLKDRITQTLGSDPTAVFATEAIIFSDFLNPNSDVRYYSEVQSTKQLLQVVNEYLVGYNERYPKKQMKLILFLDACSHVSRVCRILRQPQGNALLLGVGGSGRQSLSKLATYIMEYEIRQVEVSKNYGMAQWRDDLKNCLMYAGIKNEPVAFLFVDTQIVFEQMLEDVNNILNSGDVPNLYKQEDQQAIEDVGRPECLRKNIPPTSMNIKTQYLMRVRRNIHIILAMSPIGNVFRSRLRMFPSLINCCTIDWFHEWPEEALVSVARGQLTEEDLGIEDQFDSIIDMFKVIHKSVERRSADFLAELKRFNYVTPTSYLELLRMFKLLLNEKRKEVNLQKVRLQSGLDKLYKAQTDVSTMKLELEEKKPKLAQYQEENKRMMEHIQRDKLEADETQKKVSKEEAEAQLKNNEAEALQHEAQTELEQALPALRKAVEVLGTLKVADLVQLKSYTSPPNAVRKTMEVMCFFFKVSPTMRPDPNRVGAKIADYWDAAKSNILNDPKKFLENLIGYQKDTIQESLISKVTPYITNDPEFTPEAVEKSSGACSAICQWAYAMVKYYHVNLIVQPLKVKLEQVNGELAIVRSQLAKAQARLKEVNDQIQSLEDKYAEGMRTEAKLQADIEDCEVKLVRAEKLIGGLGGEQVRWSNEVAELGARLLLLPGDCLLSAGMVGYVGAFTGSYRQQFEKEWCDSLDTLSIKHTENITMRVTLGNPVKMQSWKVAALPSDAVSIENGIIIDKTRRWPLMIDPQSQANRYIKNMGKEHLEGIEACKASDQNLIRNIGTAIMNGKWFLMENAGQELDPALEPILAQQVLKEGAGYTIRIGEKSVDYNFSFKFFITTTLPNPHYSPETTVKVTILNFAITPTGLEEQMLAIVVAKESPELEETKNKLIVQSAQMQKQLKEIEDQILKLLQTEGNILDDEELINTLAASKLTSSEIMEKVREAVITEKEIDTAREKYRAVAFRASLLFFCIVDLSSVDPMYQYSLQWFTKLFEMAIDNSLRSNVIEERLKNLNDYFTYSLYENVCRSLFEKHKLLFSFTLAIKILQGYGEIDPLEWRYLLTGPSGSIAIPPNPASWLNENQFSIIYQEIKGASHLQVMQGLDDFFLQHVDSFKEMFDAVNAHEQPLPEPWNSKLNEFQRMIILKAIRPDKVVPAIIEWITLKLGRQFVEPPTFDLSKVYKDSTVTTPLICVLSAGSDPISSLVKFADEMGMSKKMEMISLGQGQGERARKFIEENKAKGGWVLLQNCHLAASWMPELERIVEEFDDSIHRDFRLWLTSMPAKEFPVSVLQNGVKMTVEPPQGLRSNLLLSYSNLSDKELNDCKKPDAYKVLVFSFCFFHAIVQDRRKFGPIGWNIPYEFTYEDLEVTRKQLKIFLNQDTDVVPYKVLNILGADVNYGGRVTDDKDSRLIRTILRTYICPDVFDVSYKFSSSGKYHTIPPAKIQDYVDYIKDLPLNPEPEAFGLHSNAEITTAQSETRRILETILSVQPRASSKAGKSRESQIGELAADIESRLPPLFDVEEVSLQYPTQYEESMNTVLIQEVLRYQRLLEVMKNTLNELQRALVGKTVMSEELEHIATSLFNNQVPAAWAEKGFLSLKPLSAWFSELEERVTFLSGWINNGTPRIFWVSGFFFPQAFFTGTLQNFARRHQVAIDRLNFDFNFLDNKTIADITEKPEDGCYVYGLWVEGARWDNEIHALHESNPKELYTPLPIVHFLPKIDRALQKTGIYNCPVYKVLSRTGTLSTTGHSTNFVLFMEIPSRESEDVWTKAGVALFLSLRN